MNEINKKAYAKINLSLDVIGKRSDGYHELRSVMHRIDLYDDVKIRFYDVREKKSESFAVREPLQIVVKTDCKELSDEKSNLAYKAAAYALEGRQGRVEIDIKKRIPLAAGLAGGSADAAAVIIAVEEVFGIKVESSKIGADVPFCIMAQSGQKCALAEGIGEKLTPLKSLDYFAVIISLKDGLQTAEVFKKYDIMEEAKNYSNNLIKAINTGKDIRRYIGNALTGAGMNLCPEIGKIIEKVKEYDKKINAIMTGSGPTIYCLFQNKREALELANHLTNEKWRTDVVSLD